MRMRAVRPDPGPPRPLACEQRGAEDCVVLTRSTTIRFPGRRPGRPRWRPRDSSGRRRCGSRRPGRTRSRRARAPTPPAATNPVREEDSLRGVEQSPGRIGDAGAGGLHEARGASTASSPGAPAASCGAGPGAPSTARHVPHRRDEASRQSGRNVATSSGFMWKRFTRPRRLGGSGRPTGRGPDRGRGGRRRADRSGGRSGGRKLHGNGLADAVPWRRDPKAVPRRDGDPEVAAKESDDVKVGRGGSTARAFIAWRGRPGDAPALGSDRRTLVQPSREDGDVSPRPRCPHRDWTAPEWPSRVGPRISVALCTFDGARFLQAQLESLAAQTRPPDELVACDDRLVGPDRGPAGGLRPDRALPGPHRAKPEPGSARPGTSRRPSGSARATSSPPAIRTTSGCRRSWRSARRRSRATPAWASSSRTPRSSTRIAAAPWGTGSGRRSHFDVRPGGTSSRAGVSVLLRQWLVTGATMMFRSDHRGPCSCPSRSAGSTTRGSPSWSRPWRRWAWSTVPP